MWALAFNQTQRGVMKVRSVILRRALELSRKYKILSVKNDKDLIFQVNFDQKNAIQMSKTEYNKFCESVDMTAVEVIK